MLTGSKADFMADTPKQQPTPWRPNTDADPFFKAKPPIEVQFKDGKILRISCPGCKRNLMDLVLLWRPLYAH